MRTKQIVKVIPNCSFCPHHYNMGLAIVNVSNGTAVGKEWYCNELRRTVGFDDKESEHFPEIPEDCPLEDKQKED